MTFWTLIRRSLRYHSRAHFGVVLGASIGSAALTGALLVGDSVKGTLHDRALSRLGPVEFALSTPDRFFLRDLGGRLVEEKSSGLLRSGNIALEYAAPNASSRSVALVLPGTASRQDGKARANRIEVLGVEAEFWPRLAGWSGLGKLYTRTWAGGEVLRVDELRAMELGLWPESTLSRWKAGEVVLVNETLARQLNVSEGDEVILRVRKPSALALDAVISSREEINVAFRMTVGLV